MKSVLFVRGFLKPGSAVASSRLGLAARAVAFCVGLFVLTAGVSRGATYDYVGTGTITAAATIKLNAGGAGALGSGGSFDAGNIVTAPGVGPTGIAVNNGGTLLLSNVGAASTDRVNNVAPIALGNGGAGAASITLSHTGAGGTTVSEGVGASTSSGALAGTSSIGMGALTLSTTGLTTLDFSTGGVGTLVFASFAPNGNTLNFVEGDRLPRTQAAGRLGASRFGWANGLYVNEAFILTSMNIQADADFRCWQFLIFRRLS